MATSRYVELPPETVQVILGLQTFFGTSDIPNTVAMALGLARVTSKYANQDGTLTLLKPGIDTEQLAKRIVKISVREDDVRLDNVA